MACPAQGITSCTEDMQMILPAAADSSGTTPRRRNSRTASRAHRNWPVRLTSMTNCQSLQTHLVQRRVALQAGVVDEDVDAAPLGDDLLEHRLDLVLLAHVGPDRDGLVAAGADLLHDALARARARRRS